MNRPYTTPAWTEEEEAEAKRLWEVEGKAASEIARIMGGGLTRNAVIDRLHRMGHTGKAKVRSNASRKTGKADGLVKVKRSNVGFNNGAPQGAFRAPYTPPVDTVGPNPERVNVTMLDLRHNDCRWPTGELEGQYTFCCRKAAADKPYCPGHSQLAYNPAPRSRL